jgi:antitoxin component YwqK of YwqJK toxin-antitoxin module
MCKIQLLKGLFCQLLRKPYLSCTKLIMIKKEICFLFLAFSSMVHAQSQKLYIDGNGNVINKASKAKSYIVIYDKKSQDSVWTVKQFDMRDSIISLTHYKDNQLTMLHGEALYYKNVGFKAIKGHNNIHDSTFHTNSFIHLKGEYRNGLKFGRWKEYASSNDLRSEINYINDKLNGLSKRYLNGEIIEQGNYYDDKKNGEWLIYNGKIKYNYDMGNLLTPKIGPHLTADMTDFVNKAIAKIKTKQQGTVFLHIDISKDGSVVNVKCARGLDAKINDAVIEIYRNTKWVPAYIVNTPVDCLVTQPIIFK